MCHSSQEERKKKDNNKRQQQKKTATKDNNNNHYISLHMTVISFSALDQHLGGRIFPLKTGPDGGSGYCDVMYVHTYLYCTIQVSIYLL